MKTLKKIASLAVFATLLTPALASAETSTWTLDVSHSIVGFKVSHLVVSKTTGRFKTFSGEINLDEKDVTKSSVNVEIDVASINTEDAKRDEHLRSADFFDVATFPKMTFKSTKVTKAGKDKLKVTGDLTMRGVTKPVTLDVTQNGTATSPWGKSVAGFSATGKIKRTDFGVSWNKSLDKGGVVVGEEVEINLEIEALKKTTEDAPAK